MCVSLCIKSGKNVTTLCSRTALAKCSVVKHVLTWLRRLTGNLFGLQSWQHPLCTRRNRWSYVYFAWKTLASAVLYSASDVIWWLAFLLYPCLYCTMSYASSQPESACFTIECTYRTRPLLTTACLHIEHNKNRLSTERSRFLVSQK